MLVEHVWSLVKTEWGQFLAGLTDRYDATHMEDDVAACCHAVQQRLTPAMMFSADSYMERVAEGELV